MRTIQPTNITAPNVKRHILTAYCRQPLAAKRYAALSKKVNLFVHNF